MSNRLLARLTPSRLVVGFAIAVAVLHAQETKPPQQSPQPPTFRTEANYVRVDVYPTANGVPVTDLRQDEFELLDNGVPQKIDRFEHVQIRAAGPQETRIEPNTVRESRAMLTDPRSRVFVVFLDTYHVEVSGSHDVRAPLVKALDRIISPNDLVGVMTPEMAASDVTFARKTTTIDGFLSRYWYWGERDRLIPVDPREQDYYTCYPGLGPTPSCPDDDRGVADEMVERRHEKLTLDALSDLVTFLRGVREERKAILAITDGWLLYGPDPSLARQLYCQVPSGPPIGVDPRGGRLSMKPPPGPVTTSQHDCDSDRMHLANLDDDNDFRLLLDRANRANASFYPIDPRGLAVFDTPIMKMSPGGTPPPMVPPSVDQNMLRARLTSLETLAGATDGLAIINSNNLEAGFRRVVDDLTSYYLLGFYTTAPLDGKFHKLSVRVKRSGVQVRARRGYLAATPGELTRATAAPPSPAAAKAAAEAHAIEGVIAPLGQYTREVPLRLHACSTSAKSWVTGEFGSGEARNWQTGGAVDLLLVSGSGETVASQHVSVAAGGRTFETAMPVPGAGDYEVRVRARGAMQGAMTVNEDLKVASGETGSGARFSRRGSSTANHDVPTADLRFRRSDTIRVEWPAAPAGDAHLLDRTGKALAVPVTASSREADGITWQTAQVALAPLAPADYILELVTGTDRRLAAFRVIP